MSVFYLGPQYLHQSSRRGSRVMKHYLPQQMEVSAGLRQDVSDLNVIIVCHSNSCSFTGTVTLDTNQLSVCSLGPLAKCHNQVFITAGKHFPVLQLGRIQKTCQPRPPFCSHGSQLNPAWRALNPRLSHKQLSIYEAILRYADVTACCENIEHEKKANQLKTFTMVLIDLCVFFILWISV